MFITFCVENVRLSIQGRFDLYQYTIMMLHRGQINKEALSFSWRDVLFVGFFWVFVAPGWLVVWVGEFVETFCHGSPLFILLVCSGSYLYFVLFVY